MTTPPSFWKQWIYLQLKHNLQRMVDLSIKNFHFPGLNYVCFDFAPHQTIRLYIIEPSAQLKTTDVNVHNHLYDSQILVLHGEIVNTSYLIDNDRDDYFVYALTSALHPDNADRRIKLERIARKGLTIKQRKILAPGDSHFQPHTEIHSVENDPRQLTAFMVFEFPTVKERSRIFTRIEYGDTIPTPNAYLKFTAGELAGLVGGLLEAMK